MPNGDSAGIKVSIFGFILLYASPAWAEKSRGVVETVNLYQFKHGRNVCVNASNEDVKLRFETKNRSEPETPQ